jgi:hypothetical protein
MRSGHSFPPLRAGLVMYLTRNLTPEASGALQLDQSVTIHGSGTGKKSHFIHMPYLYRIMAVLKVETDIIASIPASLTG